MTDMASAPPEFDTAAATAPAKSPPARRWLAPVWFLLAVLVVVVGFAAYTRLTVQPTPNAVATRDTAREGTSDAIATLQAGGSPVVVKTAASGNQIGAPNAPVTIVEFSDFQ